MAADESKMPDFSDVVRGSSSTAPTVREGPGAPAASPDLDLEEQATMRMYVVETGDSLSKIAKKFYGDAASWNRIYEENRELVRNPDLLQPGWLLKIPE